MKKAILILVFFLTSTISQALAQPMNRMGTNPPGIHQLIIQYGDELKLTDEQKSELIALQMEHRKQFQMNRQPMRGNRGGRGFNRGNRNSGWRGSGPRGFGNPENAGMWVEARAEMRNQVMQILTEDQQERLQSLLIEQAESDHEFRTLQHEYFVKEAGIEGDKAEKVLDLLNAQSEAHLEMAKQVIMNPDADFQALLAERLQQRRDTDNELRNLLTVDEYESLHQNMGFGFGKGPGPRQGQGPGRGYRMWNR